MNTSLVDAVENLQLQQRHPLVPTSGYSTMEEYLGGLIHRKAYEEAARIANGRELLDWGCNNGYGLELMRALGCPKVAGLDVSPVAIEAARDRLGDSVPLYLCDGSSAPLPSDSMDVVTSFQCIEHITDRDRFISEIRRVLRPGGIAVLTTPNAAIRLDPGMKPWNEYHVVEYRPKELREFLSRHFSRIYVRGLFAIPRLHRIELTRCARARAAARGYSPTRLLRSLTPVRIRQFLRRHTDNGMPPLSAYTTADLSYKTTNLEHALDLMAICEK